MNSSLSRQVHPDRRREAVERLYCKGVPQLQIAQELGIPLRTLLSDLEAIKQGWLASAQAGFDELRARELAKINHLEAVAWQGWEHSCRDQETTKVVLQGKETQRSEKTVRTQAGNQAFLNRISWCIERRSRLLGLEAAARTAKRKDDEPQDVDTIRMQVVEFIASFDERAAIADLEKASGAIGAADGNSDDAALA